MACVRGNDSFGKSVGWSMLVIVTGESVWGVPSWQSCIEVCQDMDCSLMGRVRYY